MLVQHFLMLILLYSNKNVNTYNSFVSTQNSKDTISFKKRISIDEYFEGLLVKGNLPI